LDNETLHSRHCTQNSLIACELSLNITWTTMRNFVGHLMMEILISGHGSQYPQSNT
jgi:hypothetical protein